MAYLRVNNMEERLYIMSLYDLYGNLLTDKQKTYFEEYYFDNLSLSEMSEIYNVSRSAISKSLNEITTKLKNLEDKLKIHKKIGKLTKIIKDRETLSKIEDIFKD